MIDPRESSDLEQRNARDPRKRASEKPHERSAEFTTVSGYPIRQLYTPSDLAEWELNRDLALPGEPPYQRGIHPTMYRGRLWTMRQLVGFGSADDTN